MQIKSADTKPAKLVLNMKCGDCVHFEHYAKFEKPCSKLGVMKFRDAPDCFMPNVFAFQRMSPDILNQIGILFKDFTPSLARILMGLLYKRKAYSRYGLAFGMPVYFHLGSDYLNNYYRGYVVGVNSRNSQPIVYVTSDLSKKQVSNPAILALFPDSVYNIVAFKKKRQALTEAGRMNDPKMMLTGSKKKPVADIGYEPPTMDSVPASWFDLYSKAGKEKAPFKKGKDGTIEVKVKRK